jgi:carboxypeptidase C (cathepsin A)
MEKRASLLSRLGNERWMDALPWGNASDFKAAPEKTWTVNGTEAGTVRTASGFSMVKVSGAGHMVRLLVVYSGA